MAKVVGIMSGTSLDGLDLAYCHFNELNPKEFSIIAAKTIEYPENWIHQLKNCENASARILAELHTLFSQFVAQEVKGFLKAFELPQPDLLAFHGHTIFHRPDLGYTFQLGSGAVLAVVSGIATVSDFRSANVALGGQGAPLVPLGDLHLFGDYDACINLGGFGNVSFLVNNKLVAFDLCPVNMALNELALQKGLSYDKDGLLAASGVVDTVLLGQMNKLSYYAQKPPKSLGREWYLEKFKPLLDQSTAEAENKLATVCEHIAGQISAALNQHQLSNVLVTGGGAKNTFLTNRIHKNFKGEITVPSDQIVDFKEALVFAYLGLLRLQNKPNCLMDYTGALRDISAGNLHLA
jgi:anhydro-N-acetylmuramic acid kinase